MADPNPPPRFRIGYALTSKKTNSFIRPSFLHSTSLRNLDLIPVNPTLPLSVQGPFHCLLHKLSSASWESSLLAFSSLNPSVPILDPLPSIRRLHNRLSMLQPVHSLTPSDPNLTITVPEQTLVSDASRLEFEVGLRFPVIAKPLVADGSEKSHKMVLVFHREGLLALKPPLVLQEFVNHGGVIFKVYVVGDQVRCVKRKSLPDFPPGEVPRQDSVAFSQVSNCKGNVDRDEVEDVEMPPEGFLKDIAMGLRKELRLNLFNFDVIRDVKVRNRYLVIDINYFPGFAKMPNYEAVLTDFLWKVVNGELACER